MVHKSHIILSDTTKLGPHLQWLDALCGCFQFGDKITTDESVDCPKCLWILMGLTGDEEICDQPVIVKAQRPLE